MGNSGLDFAEEFARLAEGGDFKVEFRDKTLDLGPGQCCVVPVGAEHRGTSKGGAEVILFTAVW